MDKMLCIVKYILLLLTLASSFAIGSDVTITEGLYLRYEDGEYTSAFIPCREKNAIWNVEGGPGFDELVSFYNSSEKDNYGQLHVVLIVRYEEIDKIKFPNSHYSVTIEVMEVLKDSSAKSCSNT